jgi:hypothetical protein
MNALLMLVIVVIGAVAAQAPSAPLTPVHAVRGNTLRVDWPSLSSISVQRDFRYAGGQRFILKGVADAEQHAFAAVDTRGVIERFYWFQFESLLPGATGAYDYTADAATSIAGLEWRTNVRRYVSMPEPEGDQSAVYKLFAARRWQPVLPALRARLVHIPDAERRSELMIVYAESTTSSAAPTADESAALIARAQAGLRLSR